MILRYPALVAPIWPWAYVRPLSTIDGRFDRNFTTPSGLPGLVSGFVERLEPGADITPFESVGIQHPGCFLVKQYQGPTRFALVIGYRRQWSGGSVVALNPTIERDTDLRILDFAGQNARWLSETSSYNVNVAGPLGWWRVTTTPTAVDVVHEIQCLKSAIIRFEEYEPGETGISEPSILGVAASAASALRKSDNTQQIINYGQAYLGAGRHLVTIRTPVGAIPADGTYQDWKLRIDFEIPYGI